MATVVSTLCDPARKTTTIKSGSDCWKTRVVGWRGNQTLNIKWQLKQRTLRRKKMQLRKKTKVVKTFVVLKKIFI